MDRKYPRKLRKEWGGSNRPLLTVINYSGGVQSSDGPAPSALACEALWRFDTRCHRRKCGREMDRFWRR